MSHVREHLNNKYQNHIKIFTDGSVLDSLDIGAYFYKRMSHVREHLNNKYQNHIKIFTDGSVLDSLDIGAGFVIPELKVQKSFY